jgi:hypothetical protein
MAQENVVKVYLIDTESEEPLPETIWCEAEGEINGEALYRLDNIPFFRITPTIDDVIVAAPAEWNEGALTFVRLAQPGGRYTLILHYKKPDSSLFSEVCRDLSYKYGLKIEGLQEPREDKFGTVYMAAKVETSPFEVLRWLRAVAPDWTWVLRHPRRLVPEHWFHLRLGALWRRKARPSYL